MGAHRWIHWRGTGRSQIDGDDVHEESRHRLRALQRAARLRLPKGGRDSRRGAASGRRADPNAQTCDWASIVDATCLVGDAKNAAMFELLLQFGAEATVAVSQTAWDNGGCARRGSRSRYRERQPYARRFDPLGDDVDAGTGRRHA